MPKSCAVDYCRNNALKTPDKSFFRIPSERTRRDKWLSAIRRAAKAADGSVNQQKLWSPKSVYHYVCSDHFITGKKHHDPIHPDYVPSLMRRTKQANPDTKRHERSVQRVKAKKQLELSSPADKENEPNILDESLLPDLTDELISCPNKEPNILDESVLPDVTSSDELISCCLNKDEEIRQLKMKIATLEIDNKNLKSENSKINTENVKLNIELDLMRRNNPFSMYSVMGNDERCKSLTGLDWTTVNILFRSLKFGMIERKDSIPLCDQFIITLIKLRYNVPFDLLSHAKNKPRSTIITLFWRWINRMNECLAFLVKFTDRDRIHNIIPPHFKGKFPRLTCIIDCFEIFIEAPRGLKARAQCYSNYKKHTTAKVFISCNPIGQINYISQAWGGRVSDVKLVRECGYISKNYHMPHDQILADRGFTLEDDFATECSAELIIPSFTKNKKQMSAQDIERSRKISSVRIHIERVIGLLRNRYTILKGILPIQTVQSIKNEANGNDISSIDKILTVCSALVNLDTSIVYNE